MIIDYAKNSLSSIAVSIGDSLLVDTLDREIPKLTSAISPQTAIRGGPLDLQTLATSPIVLRALREAYVIAISHIFIFATVIVCVSIPMACGMQWLNVKTISKEREDRKEASLPEQGDKSVTHQVPEPERSLGVNINS